MAHRQIKRALALMVGWALIGLGVIGLFLPVLQGILFILLGLYVLSRESKTARRLLEKLRDRYPEAYAAMQRGKAKIVTLWDRLRGRPASVDPDDDGEEKADSGKRKAETPDRGS